MTDRTARSVTAAAVVAGLVVRLCQYFWRRSFWMDEALLLLNVRDKPLGRLLGHLDYGQAAPPGFLLAERAMVATFGGGEFSARFVPLVAGCAAVVLFAVLARRVLAPWAACFAVALFALSDDLIWYSATLKPYGGDVLASVAVPLLATAAGVPALRRAAWCVAFGAVAAWFSYPAPLVAGGAAIALVVAGWRAGERPLAVPAAAVLAAAGASVAVLYLAVLRHQRDAYLDRYWAGSFADLRHPLVTARWLIEETYSLGDLPYRGLGAVVLGLAGVGAWDAWRGGRRVLVGLLVAPWVADVAAAGMHLYPYHGGRLTLFLLPGLLVLCAGGAAAAARLAGAYARPVAVGLAAVFLAYGVAFAGYHCVVPRSRSMIRPVVAYVRAHRRPGDGLYLVGEGKDKNHPAVTGGMSRELFCYWPDPPPPVHETLTDPRLVTEARFWVVFSFLPRHGLTYMAPLLRELSGVARERSRFVDPGGGAAVLFSRGTPASQPSVGPHRSHHVRRHRERSADRASYD